MQFFGGSPRQIIFDNLKAAVLNGSGRHACLHPEFLALCGHYCLHPIACERHDPESKGITEAGVRYVKHNALQGRDEELTRWEDYSRFAGYWRDQVANVRLHQTTKERPVDRFDKERPLLRPLPAHPFDTDQIVSVSVSSHAQVRFDANRYSVPPEVVGKMVLIRASDTRVRVLYQGREIACHDRCYDRSQLIRQPAHHLEALKLRRRNQANHLEKAFDALGEQARKFHLELRRRPAKTSVQLRRLLHLVQVYGREQVVAAIARANDYQTYDAAYVETILLQERRRQELPSPTELRPQRQDLVDEIDLDESDPGVYDRLCDDGQEEESAHE